MDQLHYLINFIVVIFWLGLIPYCCGLPIAVKLDKGTNKLNHGMVFAGGYFVMLSLFQVIYLFFVLYYNQFTPLVWTFAGSIIVVACVSAIYAWWRAKNMQKIKGTSEKLTITEFAGWLVFAFLIVFMLYKTLFYSYYDGDDAFYTVIAVITDTNDNMYKSLPYTGESTVLDQRHAFSSAPVFIAFIGRVCGIHPTIVANTAFSVVAIVLTFVLYKLVAEYLLEKDRKYIPLFLCFIVGIYLFGNDTIYKDTTFLLTRTGQGKAFLANIIPVAILLGLLIVNHREKRGDKHSGSEWVFLSMIMITAGYTSTMGLFLAPFLVGGGSLLLAMRYKRWKILLNMVLSMLPPLSLGVMYLITI